MIFSIVRLACPLPVWHENHERRTSEVCGRPSSEYPDSNDDQPGDRCVDRYAHHRIGAIFFCHDGYGREFRKCGFVDLNTIHQCHYGSQYRNYGYRLDYFGFGLQGGHFRLCPSALGFWHPASFLAKSSRKSIGEFIFGFSFLFMGLDLLKKNAPDLSQNPDMLAFVQNYTDMGFFRSSCS